MRIEWDNFWERIDANNFIDDMGKENGKYLVNMCQCKGDPDEVRF